MVRRDGGGRSRWRRGAAALAAGVLVAVAAAPGGAGAQTEPEPVPEAAPEPPSDVLLSGGGILGTMSAQVLSVVPIIGDFSLPLKIGVAGAQVDGEVRRANSIAADLGLLGTLGTLAITGAPTLKRLGIPAGELIGGFQLPGPTAADSRDVTDAEARPVLPDVPIGPVTLGGGHQEAHAAEGDTAVARTELGDVTLELGVVTVELNGGVSETIADSTHVAATTALGEMRFRSGALELGSLQGLEWRFEQQLDQPPTASFSLGSGRFGALSFPVSADGFAPVAAALTQALAPLGVSLTLPEPRADGGITPLRLALDDAPLAGQLVRPFYSAALADAVNDAQGSIVGGVPETGLVFTVANVVLSALTGQGGAAVELGGITGGIKRRELEEFAYGSFPAPPPPSLPTAGVDTAGPVSSPSLGGSGPSGSAPPSATPTESPEAPRQSSQPVLSQLASAVADEVVPALLVVLGGIGAAVGMAAMDRRRIAAIVGGGRGA